MNISSRPFKTFANVEYLKFKIIWKLKFSKVHIFESSKIIPGKSLNISNFQTKNKFIYNIYIYKF